MNLTKFLTSQNASRAVPNPCVFGTKIQGGVCHCCFSRFLSSLISLFHCIHLPHPHPPHYSLLHHGTKGTRTEHNGCSQRVLNSFPCRRLKRLSIYMDCHLKI